jgi:hypothetical protein
MSRLKNKKLSLSCLVFFILFGFLMSNAQAAKVLLVFDNSLQPRTSLDGKARSQMILRSLKTAGVNQAAFLVDTYGLNARDRERLVLYSEAGHLLVNKGHNQSLVSKKNIYTMQARLLKANGLLQAYPTYHQHIHLDWLNENPDPEAQKKMLRFLNEYNFIPVSSGNLPMRGIDQYLDYLYQYRKKINKPVSMEKLRDIYVKLIVDDLQTVNAEASLNLGYSPVQILTLQANDVTAYFLLALLDELANKGWQWARAEQVYADPVVNHYARFGFAASSYKKAVAPFLQDTASYPRVAGSRQKKVDHLLQTNLPELLAR